MLEQKKPLRLAAFDMDGTLLMPDHRLGEKTLSSLRELAERRVTLVFATGRHYLEMKQILANINIPGYLITGNGTRVHDLNGTLLHASNLPEDNFKTLISQKWPTAASFHVFRDDGWVTNQDMPELLHAHQFSGFRYQLSELENISASGNSKVCFCAAHDELLALLPVLQTFFGDRLDFCFSAYDCLDVMPVGSNKGSALALLTEKLGIPLSECMAFGDAMNDREMLESVGRGLVMGNALPQLKQQVAHLEVIGHCKNQAVSHFLQHWLNSPTLTYSPEY
ncbi:HMP-PP phosphatase [Rouxiella sp. S1S-2]|uniref:HMP-PP phosphatase n=1 Tax=Rouxiella sp. S1S-2 TaxID=2653856 RepID=UPI001264CD1E|nr:HMP-PP phosphatase [Rouxiella sp. S1S-2]KAB7898092.1 HMP-PP phosphatase [Rouxiella sp. S1S-2]